MSVFAGLRVLEFGPFLSAHYCGKLFADLGAEVLKLEPLGGDWTRNRGPFPQDEPDPEASGLFLSLNTNKLGLTLDAEAPEGRELFLELVRDADVLIDGHAPGTLARLGLAPDRLRELNPGLIVALVSPFGQNGPYRDYHATTLTLFHLGGEAFCLPGGPSYDLNMDREPIKAPGYIGDLDGGVVAAGAVATALFWRNLSGEGQEIDVSVHDGLLLQHGVEVERWADEGALDSRATRSVPGGIIPCQDGFAILQPVADHMWGALVKFLGEPAWALEPRFSDRTARLGLGHEIRAGMAEWAKDKTKDEVYHAGQAANIPAAAVYTPEEVLKSPHEAARGFFVELDHPHAGTLRYPGAPHRFPAAPVEFRHAAPLLGQHNDEVYGRMGKSAADLAALRRAGAIS